MSEEKRIRYNEYQRKYREANRERIRELRNRWYRNNTDKVKEYQKKNEEEIKAYQKNYREENK